MGSPRSKKLSDLPQDQQEGLAHLFGAVRDAKALYETCRGLVLLKREEQKAPVRKAGKLKKAMGQEAGSSVGEEPGEQPKPFDFHAATMFKAHNVHHSTCIRAKTRALVGLGHVTEEDFAAPEPREYDEGGNEMPKPKKKPKVPSKVAMALDPLCQFSWQHTLLQLAEDYWQTGNCFLEVVRESLNGKILGLHWQPACDVWIYLEEWTGSKRHYLVRGRTGGDVRMRPYGDPRPIGTVSTGFSVAPSGRSEIIHIASPSTMDRIYGVPQWLASGPLVELTQALHQHQFDFHVNRGVPEFLMMLSGGRVDKKTWNKIIQTFDSWVGLGNQHKASVMNIPDPNIKPEVIKMAMEGIQNGTFFRDMSETLSTAIVSAHGVPPSLAGILIPGKMGASNESSNAMMVFQTLEIGPEQEHFETMLGARLGNPEMNGGLGLVREDFELRTLTEEMAEAMKLLKPADTMQRMKQELPQAAAEGRKLESGVKKSVGLLAEALSKAARGE